MASLFKHREVVKVERSQASETDHREMQIAFNMSRLDAELVDGFDTCRELLKMPKFRSWLALKTREDLAHAEHWLQNVATYESKAAADRASATMTYKLFKRSIDHTYMRQKLGSRYYSWQRDQAEKSAKHALKKTRAEAALKVWACAKNSSAGDCPPGGPIDSQLQASRLKSQLVFFRQAQVMQHALDTLGGYVLTTLCALRCQVSIVSGWRARRTRSVSCATDRTMRGL